MGTVTVPPGLTVCEAMLIVEAAAAGNTKTISNISGHKIAFIFLFFNKLI
jgi:hypothetical protein